MPVHVGVGGPVSMHPSPVACNNSPLLSPVSSSHSFGLCLLPEDAAQATPNPLTLLPSLHPVFITLNCSVSSGAALTLIIFAFQGAPGTQAYTWQPGPQVRSFLPASSA